MEQRNEFIALDQLVRELDESLLGARDNLAARLGFAALAGISDSEQREKFILFSIGNKRLAAPIANVAEVGDLPPVTELPNLPGWVLGIINVRSEIVSVVDLVRFLDWDVGSTIRGTRSIILRERRVKVALKIDRVLGTYNRTDKSKVVEGRPSSARKDNDLLPECLMIGGQPHYVLDCNALLANERFVEAR